MCQDFEDDTMSSSCIFVKIMMQEMMEGMGLKSLAERFENPEVQRGCEGMFPMYVLKNTRFAINYFMSIGLEIITEGMREYLKVDSFILSSFGMLITIIII
jgi:pre-mRNA-splicing factor CWC22